MQKNKTEKEIIQELMQRIEILEQQNKQKQNRSTWDCVKSEIKGDLEGFHWVEKWENPNTSKVNTYNHNGAEAVSTALATLIRISLKKKRIALLEESDKEKASNLAHTIINAMKETFEGGE